MILAGLGVFLMLLGLLMAAASGVQGLLVFLAGATWVGAGAVVSEIRAIRKDQRVARFGAMIDR